jgi:hypothetical protein
MQAKRHHTSPSHRERCGWQWSLEQRFWAHTAPTQALEEFGARILHFARGRGWVQAQPDQFLLNFGEHWLTLLGK